MIQIAIVDDESVAREGIKKCLSLVAEREKTQFSVTEFESGLAFIGSYKPVYDIVFLDIEMPGADGLETARMLREADKSVIIIFVTNMAQYALRGYEVEALDFIVKPLNPYDFAMKMHRAVARTTKRTDDAVTIKTEGEIYTVPAAAVKYLEVDGHYVVWHTLHGTYNEYTTLKNAEAKIGKSFFVRCNRCYLVNLRFVESVKRDSVILGGGVTP